jgi:hypothetical protein
MAIKVKHKKAPRHARRHPKKTAHHQKSSPLHKNKAGAHAEKKAPVVSAAPGKPAAVKKPAAATKPAAPAKRPASRSMLAQRPKPRREFFVAAEPVRGSAVLPFKKKKKKQKTVLRFTENTLRDIAALECVRRCFR